MPRDVERHETVPDDRLGRIADGMHDFAKEHEEFDPETDKLIVALNGKGRGMLGYTGYESDDEMIAEMFEHLTAAFKLKGMRLYVARADDLFRSQN